MLKVETRFVAVIVFTNSHLQYPCATLLLRPHPVLHKALRIL